MLERLHVSNYILIGNLDTDFPDSLVIITGETGAGKSILLGALSLLLGAKGDSGMVGPLGDTCVVEGWFRMEDKVRALLEAHDLPSEDDTLILRRVLSKSGRSRCFVGDEPISLPLVQQLSDLLIDVHAQHQTLRLQDGAFRMETLDAFAGCAGLRGDCAKAWTRFVHARAEAEAWRRQSDRDAREQAYDEAQLAELNAANLLAGEQEALEQEQKALSNTQQIQSSLAAAETLLQGDGQSERDGVCPALHEAQRQLAKAQAFLPALTPLVERLESARVEVDDIAAELSRRGAEADASPERLRQVEERLSLLYTLLRKHGESTVEGLIARRDALARRLEGSEHPEEVLARLAQAEEEARAAHASLCKALHEKRSLSAGAFAEEVTAHLRQLDMEGAVFRVSVDESEAGATGSDLVRFRFTYGAGATESEVGKTASGGELSRIMLAIKAVTARHAQLPTLVFDEIDSGVSGGTADKMGTLVCAMGQHMQVFAITHLPQVAAKGSAHYLVRKEAGKTAIQPLSGEGRVQEIARMLSGSSITPEAVANARSLLAEKV